MAVFISICNCTYGSWNLYISIISNHIGYLLRILLGILVHLTSGVYLIHLKLNWGTFLLYGLIYFFWCTAAILNSNSLIDIFTERLPYHHYLYSWIIIIIFTFLSVVCNYPYYYLNFVSNVIENLTHNRNLFNRTFNFIFANRHAIVFILYVCIFSFCFSVGLLWSLILSNFI